ncbi:XdhC family protein [Leptolyngbya sp. NIES-2104]|uniref:XdhC family protein n=1 Tax=Leptolyngbya sp. NIES-2104 TaxID=1552121 RepID=UPI0006EC8F41|nr:XdhC/CoxI family protein [Leptolyngbya sp. NIES-2104]GAP98952.1 xanthine and CO dehydrogenases maturation factor, XdhC/CoxF family [Leptolyngbya sp. NIES-2104]
MPDHYRQLLEKMPAVLATVVQIKGSVPREVGAKMIITETEIFGTIGGGAGEAKVIRQALEVLATGEKQWVEIDLTGAPQRETQGICGGIMQVWLERWDSDRYRSLIQQILTKLESGQTVSIVTPFNAEQFPYLSRDCPEQAFIETIEPAPTLLIVGAGHCGIELAKVANLIGFQVIVQDDRANWANVDRYPNAKIFNTPIDETVNQLATHTQLYAALVTRGYQYDLAALKALVDRPIPCRYIGMIGSEKRVRQVFQSSEISREKLRSIYAPIGLDIGALTPEEIAISISAELILVRRGGTGRSLSQSLRMID